MAEMSRKTKVLNREARISAELITSGLENLRKVAQGHAFYYQAFYSLGIGLERLMKLIAHLENGNHEFGHDLESLGQDIGLDLSGKPIQENLLLFLTDFAKDEDYGGRYSILDYLKNDKEEDMEGEPIVKFYDEIVQDILESKPPKNITKLEANFEFKNVLFIKEDFSQTDNYTEYSQHKKVIDHASKYAVMYLGRLLQPLIEKLSRYDGPPENPFFSAHFRYLQQPDSFFLKRKTYRS
jgi:hypothetical protein